MNTKILRLPPFLQGKEYAVCPEILEYWDGRNIPINVVTIKRDGSTEMYTIWENQEFIDKQVQWFKSYGSSYARMWWENGQWYQVLLHQVNESIDELPF